MQTLKSIFKFVGPPLLYVAMLLIIGFVVFNAGSINLATMSAVISNIVVKALKWFLGLDSKVNIELFRYILWAWIFSSVLVWPLVGNVFFGSTFSKTEHKVYHIVAFTLAMVSWITFLYVAPSLFSQALEMDIADSFERSAQLGMFVWIFFHMGGGLLIIFRSISLYIKHVRLSKVSSK